MAKVTVTPNQRALQDFMNRQGGPVQRFLDEKARQVEAAAKRNISARAVGGTGELEGSIHTGSTSNGSQFLTPNATNVARGKTVYSKVDHAEFTETGTGPAHETTNGGGDARANYWPDASNSLIAWANRNGLGHLIHLSRNGRLNAYLLQKHIHDNGTPAYHWMLDALKEVFPTANGRFGR